VPRAIECVEGVPVGLPSKMHTAPRDLRERDDAAGRPIHVRRWRGARDSGLIRHDRCIGIQVHGDHAQLTDREQPHAGMKTVTARAPRRALLAVLVEGAIAAAAGLAGVIAAGDIAAGDIAGDDLRDSRGQTREPERGDDHQQTQEHGCDPVRPGEPAHCHVRGHAEMMGLGPGDRQAVPLTPELSQSFYRKDVVR